MIRESAEAGNPAPWIALSGHRFRGLYNSKLHKLILTVGCKEDVIQLLPVAPVGVASRSVGALPGLRQGRKARPIGIQISDDEPQTCRRGCQPPGYYSCCQAALGLGFLGSRPL